MKARNFIFIGVLLALVIAAAVFTLPAVADKETVVVGVLPTEGIRIIGKNPVTVNKGDSVTFLYEADEGYFVLSSDVGSVKDGKIVIASASLSRTVRLTTGKSCKISLTTYGEGTASLKESTLDTGSKANVTLKPGENYEVLSIKVNGKESPIPADNKFRFTVEDDSLVEVTFGGKKVTFMTVTGNLGRATVTNKTDIYRYGDTLHLTCEYDKEHIVFGGWSENGYLSDGGRLISTEEDYNYLITSNSVLYANFTDRSSYDLMFDANGGVINGTVNGSYAPGEYVNLPLSGGTFTRDGYCLVGFSENADGTGRIFLPGAMTVMPRENTTLYAVWEANTDPDYLEYYDTGFGITVMGLSDSGMALAGDTLCIPDKIDGGKVTAIAGGAFAGCSFKKVIIPPGVTAVFGSAFANCPSLETVYLPETLTSLEYDAFAGSASLKNLRVLASLDRVFDYDYDSALADKFMRMRTTDGKRLIIVSGSSASFGINSQMLKDAYPDYQIINFSASVSYGILPMLEMLKNEVHEGDVVVFAPEYYYIMYGYGETDTITNWQYLESNYDILADIDIRNTPALLSTFVPYLAEKRAYLPGKKINADNVYVRSAFNQMGDLTSYRSNKYYFDLSLVGAGLITEEGMRKYNETAAYLTSKGAKCVFSFPPNPLGSSNKDAVKAAMSDFTFRLNSMLDSNYCKVISNVEDYFFPSEYFYDNVYHLTLEGANIRTEQLVIDLASVIGR